MSEREDFWIECDGCGIESFRYGAPHKARIEIQTDGWITQGNFSHPKHFCPECQRQGKAPAQLREVQP